MDKKIAGLLGAAAALATVSGANATEVQGNVPEPCSELSGFAQSGPESARGLKGR